MRIENKARYSKKFVKRLLEEVDDIFLYIIRFPARKNRWDYFKQHEAKENTFKYTLDFKSKSGKNYQLHLFLDDLNWFQKWFPYIWSGFRYRIEEIVYDDDLIKRWTVVRGDVYHDFLFADKIIKLLKFVNVKPEFTLDDITLELVKK